MAKRDYYEVLGVEREASADELKRAYRQLAMKYHPDRNQDNPAAEDAFKECSEAYSVLSDAEKRKRYDRMGHSAFGGAAGGAAGGAVYENFDFGSMSEMLEGLFGDMFRSKKPSSRIGEDISADLPVTFEEAAVGGDKTLRVKRTVACSDCAGTGGAKGSTVETCSACKGRGEVRFQRGFMLTTRPCQMCAGSGVKIETPCATCIGQGARPSEDEFTVTVPPGVADGVVRTLRGGGHRGPGGSGDLHVYVRLQPHPFFAREGADITCTVPVSFPQAALGAQVEVPTLEGKVKMRVPEGTQSGKVFRLRGKGFPVFGGYGKGDQLVTVSVEIPTQLSPRQRELIEQLSRELSDEAQPDRKSFVDKLKNLFG